MLSGVPYFNSELSVRNVSAVTRMRSMFRNATLFNSNISAWDISNVADMTDILAGASSFSQNLCDWATGFQDELVVRNMFAGMRCTISDDPNASSFDKGPWCLDCFL
jgi:surface protein